MKNVALTIAAEKSCLRSTSIARGGSQERNTTPSENMSVQRLKSILGACKKQRATEHSCVPDAVQHKRSEVMHR